MSGFQAITNKTQSPLSTEPFYVIVNAQIPGGTPVNVSSDTVKFAFKPEGAAPNTPPSGSDWFTGSWQTVVQGTTTTYVAYVMVGPGGTVTTLAAGEYVVWIYLNDSLGQPVAQVGTLTITSL